jgi:hypothetical protein
VCCDEGRSGGEEMVHGYKCFEWWRIMWSCLPLSYF